MRSRFAKSISLAAALVALLLAASVPSTLHAQESRGKITGTVTDPNKASVPGASVTVSDPTRGTSVALTTNDEGFFQAPYLLPGTYQIIVEMAGFKKFIQEGVILQINETRALDI
ncbi:MAG TPA: carboxypeptidase-like regulatory domain-containing protein, partial [Pyrinomonadaceae bacterium]|nr:carboxypeptidase-like regulatory domain-containing protein [Pyrinomonadaceae bacterium]